MRTFFDRDKILMTINNEPFKRFKSLSELPFNWVDCSSQVPDSLINHYREMITKQLYSKFKIPSLSVSEQGSIVNVDAALEGISECFLHVRHVRSVLKLGLNVSAQAQVTDELFAMRCAAIMAVWQLAKSRGQKVQFDACYGANVYNKSNPTVKHSRCHFRITMPTMTDELIKKIMSEKFRARFAGWIEDSMGNYAGYRLHQLIKDVPKLTDEFDFCLDRIETPEPEVEYARILKQIERLRAK